MKIIKYEILKEEVGVLIGEKTKCVKELEKYNEELARILKEEEHHFGLTMVASSRGSAIIVWLETKEPPQVAHEAVHVATALMDRAGIPISEENDEVLAYLVEYTVKEMCK
jgi:hypothetical protein